MHNTEGTADETTKGLQVVQKWSQGSVQRESLIKKSNTYRVHNQGGQGRR